MDGRKIGHVPQNVYHHAVFQKEVQGVVMLKNLVKRGNFELQVTSLRLSPVLVQYVLKVIESVFH